MSSLLNNVLVVLSSHSNLIMREGKIIKTGFFLVELAKPLISLMKAGYNPVFATPLGNDRPSMDPMSDSWVWFGSKQDYEEAKAMLQKLSTEGNFSSPRKLSSFTNEELDSQFAGVFIPGGHAPVMDLYKDPDLGRLLKYFHSRKKPTAAICHGPAGLLSAGIVNVDAGQPNRPSFSVLSDWIYNGYAMTAYSDREEKINELMWRDKVPFYVEEALKNAGGVLQTRWPFLPNVVKDRELITGQGPTSGGQLADLFVESLRIVTAGNPLY